MELAKNLIRACKERHLSLAGLARLSGVKQPTLHGWTTGRSVHKLDDLVKVCEVLQVSVYYILYGKPDPYEGSEVIEEFVWGNVKIVLYRVRKD